MIATLVSLAALGLSVAAFLRATDVRERREDQTYEIFRGGES